MTTNITWRKLPTLLFPACLEFIKCGWLRAKHKNAGVDLPTASTTVQSINNPTDHLLTWYHFITGCVTPAPTYPCFTVKCSRRGIIHIKQLNKEAIYESAFLNAVAVRFNYTGVRYYFPASSPLGPIIQQIIELGFLSPLCPVESKGWCGQWEMWLCRTGESFRIKGELTKVKLCDNYSVCQPMFCNSNAI